MNGTYKKAWRDPLSWNFTVASVDSRVLTVEAYRFLHFDGWIVCNENNQGSDSCD